MSGLINLGAGLSQMGQAIADVGTSGMKQELDKQKLLLASQLSGQQYDVAAKRIALAPQAASVDAYLKATGHPNGLKDFGIDIGGVMGGGDGAAGPAQTTPAPAPEPSAAGVINSASSQSDSSAPAAGSAPAAPGGNTKAPMRSFSDEDAAAAFPKGAPLVMPVGSKAKAMGVPLPPGWTPEQAAIAGPEGLRSAWAEWAKPQNMREGSTLSYFDFASGQMKTLTRTPKMPMGTYYDADTNSTVQIAGALPAIKSSAQAEAYGKSQGELPGELEKIGATGAQARKTSEFNAGVEAATTLVPSYNPSSKTTTLVTKADQLAAIRSGKSVQAAPDGAPPPGPANGGIGLQKDGSYRTSNGTIIPPKPQPIGGARGVQAKPSAADEATQASYGETIKGWEDAVEPSIMAEQRFKAMADALKATSSGQWAQRSYDVAQALGIPKLAGTSVADAQIILKNNFGAALNVLSSTKGLSRFTQNELAASQKNLPSIGLQPEANAAIIAQSIGAARFQRSMAEDWNQAQSMGYTDPLQFRDDWIKANPIQGFIDQAKKEIGPLKGMKAAGGDNANTAAAAMPAMADRVAGKTKWTNPNGVDLTWNGQGWVQ